jgi:hypothetical protein
VRASGLVGSLHRGGRGPVLQSIVEAHPELCHYTGAAGLKGIIIESNSFRATYFADMNDAQEIHALRVHLVDELKKRLETAVKQATELAAEMERMAWPQAHTRQACTERLRTATGVRAD